jgi:hypothetical protein
MQAVFVVRDANSPSGIVAVYSTKAQAEACVAACRREDPKATDESVWIVIATVDPQ